MRIPRVVLIWVVLLLGTHSAFAQQEPAAPAPQQTIAVRPDYILGPNDQILIRSNAEEISDRPYRVDQDGFINLPLVNRVQVTGLTVTALERDLIARLRMFLVAPEVSITVTGFRNEPVSFFGAFAKQGIYPLTGTRTLVEMLTVAGGLLPSASRRLRVTRLAENGPIPLPGVVVDPVTKTSSVEIELSHLTQELNPIEDIELKANDRVFADAAQPVYVGGEVARPAAVELGIRDSLTVMQALTQVGGFGAAAKRKKVYVLRPVSGTGKVANIEIDIQKIIHGEDNDFPLYANDILFVDRVNPIVGAFPAALTSMMTSLPYALITAAIVR